MAGPVLCSIRDTYKKYRMHLQALFAWNKNNFV